ncbi:MAG: hypothetical protein R3C44_01740 [Chloroflexota bacterium]
MATDFGHMTATRAAQLARDNDVKTLILTTCHAAIPSAISARKHGRFSPTPTSPVTLTIFRSRVMV